MMLRCFFMVKLVYPSGIPFTQSGQAVNIENGQERYSNAQPVHIETSNPYTSTRATVHIDSNERDGRPIRQQRKLKPSESKK